MAKKNDAVTRRLHANADDCVLEAKLSIAHALTSLNEGEDDDRTLGHLLDAVMHIGEARGHRNAAVDVLEES